MADPGFLEKLIQAESSGDPNAKAATSSASGLFQFTEATWQEYVDKLGLDYSLDDRFDPEKALKVAEAFTEDNKVYLETRLGREPNDTEMYLAHFLGRRGALDTISKVDNGQNIPMSQLVSEGAFNSNKAVFLNEDSTENGAIDIYNWAAGKFGNNPIEAPPDNTRSVNEELLYNDPDLQGEDMEALQTQNEEFGFTDDFINTLDFSENIFNPIPDLEETPEAATTEDIQGAGLGFTDDIKAVYGKGGRLPIDQNDKFLKEINEGGTHEENPLGGVPVSTNPQGGQNLVEEGEAITPDNYVLSDRELITEQHIEDYNINPLYEGLTFAEAGRKENEPIKDSPYDKMLIKTANQNFNQLAYANQSVIDKKEMGKKRQPKDKVAAPGGKLDNILGLIGSAGGAASAIPGVGGAIGAGVSMLTPILGELLGKKGKLEQKNQNSLAFNSQFPQGGYADPNDPNVPEHLKALTNNNNLIGTYPYEPNPNGIGLLGDNELGITINDYSQYPIDPIQSIDNSNSFTQDDINSITDSIYPQANPIEGNPSTATTSTNVNGAGTSNPSDIPSTSLRELTQALYPTSTNPLGPVGGDTSISAPILGPQGDATYNSTLADLTEGTEEEGQAGRGVGSYINQALRYAPVLGIAASLLFGDNEPEVATFNKLGDRFSPQLLDSQSFSQAARQSGANVRNSLSQVTGGSGAATLGALLGSQINETRGVSEGEQAGRAYNANQLNRADAENIRIGQFNIGQDNLQTQTNMANRGAAQGRKDSLLQSLLASVGDIGKEEVLNESITNVTGYNKLAEYLGLTKPVNLDKTAADGGLLEVYNKHKNPDAPLRNIIKQLYGY